MPTQADYNTEATRALAAMSPARRAAQQFVNTLANAGNTVTFGGLGAAGDIARGLPLGTTGGQIETQLDAQAPTARVASQVLGYAAPAGATKAVVAAAPAAARAVLTAAPAVGVRAAELGATTTPYWKTAAKFLAPLAAATGVTKLLTSPADAVEPAAQPAPATQAAAGAAALAAGSGKKATPQDALAAAVTRVLSNNPSLSDVATAGALVPTTVKQGQTAKDAVFGSTAALSQQIFQQQIADIQAQVAAGTLTQDAGREAVGKATTGYYQRNASLVGMNPQNLAMAQLLEDGAQ